MFHYVLTDVHEHHKTLNDVIKRIRPTALSITLNGDFFDSYLDDTEKSAIETCKILKDCLYDPLFNIHRGNHDLQYEFPNNNHVVCATNNPMGLLRRYQGIEKMLTKQDWAQFKFFTFIEGWLISHAGINKNMLHPVNGFSLDYLTELSKQAIIKLEVESNHFFVHAGSARGGSFGDHGGIVWQDWNAEFKPLDGIYQLVGHSKNRNGEPRARMRWDSRIKSVNWCFDSRFSIMARIDEKGEVSFEDI